MSEKRVELQKEAAFRSTFSDGNLQCDVSGPISISVMEWGVSRGYARMIETKKPDAEMMAAGKLVNFTPGEVRTYRLTAEGRAAMQDVR